MNRHWRAVWFWALVLVVFWLPELQGQQSPARDLLNVLPSAIHVHAVALGRRVTVPGSERTAYTGHLMGASLGQTPLRIVVQLPNLVLVEGLRPNALPIVFDGKNAVYPAGSIEGQLVEVFSSDTAEGMLASVKEGAATQLLGRRVLLNPGGSGNAQRADIFEVSLRVLSDPTGRERLKRYYFDSETGLLLKTAYLDETFSPPMSVEVLFSGWKKQNDSAYPQQIDRRENGQSTFSLNLSSIVALPRQDPAIFATSAQTGLQEE